MREVVDTIVVGAGPAGLAMARCLGKAKIPHVVFDAAGAVGSSWRGHYARLHLHTIKHLSHLPDRPFPATYPTYPSRAEIVDYLEDYARAFGIAPRLSERVERVEAVPGGLEVDTTGAKLLARRVVIATGYSAEPVRPTWPGEEGFPGPIVHTSSYSTGAPYAGRRVLVVGAGNSGAEIALDLFEHGAAVTMCVRGPVHVVPRDLFGIPAQLTSIAMSHLPRAVADRASLALLDRAVGDLTPLGLVRPKFGPIEQVERLGRIPLIDIGTVSLIAQGRIAVRPDLVRFSGERVEFADRRAEPFDAVVLATGYRPSFGRFLRGVERVVDARGYPTAHGAVSAIPGLYFLGFGNPVTGALRAIRLDAERLGATLAKERRS